VGLPVFAFDGDGESEGERQSLAEPSNAISAQASNRSTVVCRTSTLRGEESMFDSTRCHAACITEAGAAWVTCHFLAASSYLSELRGRLTKSVFPDDPQHKAGLLEAPRMKRALEV